MLLPTHLQQCLSPWPRKRLGTQSEALKYKTCNPGADRGNHFLKDHFGQLPQEHSSLCQQHAFLYEDESDGEQGLGATLPLAAAGQVSLKVC